MESRLVVNKNFYYKNFSLTPQNIRILYSLETTGTDECMSYPVSFPFIHTSYIYINRRITLDRLMNGLDPYGDIRVVVLLFILIIIIDDEWLASSISLCFVAVDSAWIGPLDDRAAFFTEVEAWMMDSWSPVRCCRKNNSWNLDWCLLKNEALLIFSAAPAELVSVSCIAFTPKRSIVSASWWNCNSMSDINFDEGDTPTTG